MVAGGGLGGPVPADCGFEISGLREIRPSEGETGPHEAEVPAVPAPRFLRPRHGAHFSRGAR